MRLTGMQSSLAPDGSLTLSKSSAGLGDVPRNELIGSPDSVNRQELLHWKSPVMRQSGAPCWAALLPGGLCGPRPPKGHKYLSCQTSSKLHGI